MARERVPAECEAILRRFEVCWRDGTTPDLDAFLPPAGSLPTRLAFELIQIDMDFRLCRGERVRVEDYLRRHPVLRRDRAAMVELIVAEFARRRCWGKESTS